MIVGPHIVTDGLVLSLDSTDERSYTSGSIVWNDLSGNGNHAHLTYDGTNTASFDEKMSWSGSGDFRYFSYTPNAQTSSVDSTLGSYWIINGNESLSPNTSGEWTVSGWTQHNGEPEFPNGTGWFAYGNSDLGVHIELHGPSLLRINVVYRVVNEVSSSGWSIISKNISDYMYEWHNWTVTYSTSGSYGIDPGNLKLYIDGILDTSVVGIPRIVGTTEKLSLGRRPGHYRHYQNADVSNYLYYLRELSPQEIQQNFNAQKTRFNLP